MATSTECYPFESGRRIYVSCPFPLGFFFFYIFPIEIHMVIHRLSTLTHSSRKAIHNLKKFLVFLARKYTPVVQKEFKANILPERRNTRMQFQAFRRVSPRKIKSRQPLRRQCRPGFFTLRPARGIFYGCPAGLSCSGFGWLSFDP